MVILHCHVSFRGGISKLLKNGSSIPPASKSAMQLKSIPHVLSKRSASHGWKFGDEWANWRRETHTTSNGLLGVFVALVPVFSCWFSRKISEKRTDLHTTPLNQDIFGKNITLGVPNPLLIWSLMAFIGYPSPYDTGNQEHPNKTLVHTSNQEFLIFVFVLGCVVRLAAMGDIEEFWTGMN